MRPFMKYDPKYGIYAAQVQMERNPFGEGVVN